MTIKEFAGLRGCTAQTLRCYDRINCACLPAEQGENSLRLLWKPAEETENGPGGSGKSPCFSPC